MANRAYLYSASEDLSKLRDLSESRYPIPFFYKVLLGEDTTVCNSRIWEYEHPIAIKGDFQKGLDKLNAFFDYLQTQDKVDKAAIAGFQAETKAFWEKEKERVDKYFFLEAGEIFDLIASEDDPIERQNADLYKEIKGISQLITQILAEKPKNVFAFSDVYWLKSLKKEKDYLAVYWTHVTYFSFNKS